ncbi:uncharacterized protein METZ01_LOCUS43582 [marine metagenome]|uniref:Uncharacterized protein n=1 Tax=marine metagenome TaxID=408172 RepID=A0A381RIE8_9ZZZZ
MTKFYYRAAFQGEHGNNFFTIALGRSTEKGLSHRGA